MNVSEEQIRSYHAQGYLLVPKLFGEDEVRSLQEALPGIYSKQDGPIVREEDGSIRLVFGVHLWSDRFDRLARNPRLVNPARQLLGGSVYIHQSKVVGKTPLAGNGFPWHQDYIFWKKRDRLPAPRALSAIIFLDPVSQVNGPIYVLAGSHRQGLVDEETYSLGYDVIRSMKGRYRVDVPEGPAGSVVFLDSVVLHGSPTNISPYDRTLAFVTYNRVDNAPPLFDGQPPEFVSNPDHREVVMISEDLAL